MYTEKIRIQINVIFLQSFDIFIVLLNKRKGTERNFNLHNNVSTFF